MKKSGFNVELAFTFSDEVNFVIIQPLPFNGRLDKILSTSASGFTTFFFKELSKRFSKTESFLGFDSKVIIINNEKEILDHLKLRQLDCFRNHNNSWAQWCLMNNEFSGKETNKILRNLKTKDLRDLCLKSNINLNKTPQWQRNGVVLKWISFKKKGFNPITQQNLSISRRKVIIEDAPRFK